MSDQEFEHLTQPYVENSNLEQIKKDLEILPKQQRNEAIEAFRCIDMWLYLDLRACFGWPCGRRFGEKGATN